MIVLSLSAETMKKQLIHTKARVVFHNVCIAIIYFIYRMLLLISPDGVVQKICLESVYPPHTQIPKQTIVHVSMSYVCAAL